MNTLTTQCILTAKVEIQFMLQNYEFEFRFDVMVPFSHAVSKTKLCWIWNFRAFIFANVLAKLYGRFASDSQREFTLITRVELEYIIYIRLVLILIFFSNFYGYPFENGATPRKNSQFDDNNFRVEYTLSIDLNRNLKWNLNRNLIRKLNRKLICTLRNMRLKRPYKLLAFILSSFEIQNQFQKRMKIKIQTNLESKAKTISIFFIQLIKNICANFC